MSKKPDDSVCVFGAIALQRNLEALRQEIEGVRTGEDIECVHKMRVASRRIRSALELFEDCLPARRFADWEKTIHAITRALGAARDTDVQLAVVGDFAKQHSGVREKPGLHRVLLRLQQNRANLQEKVLKTLDRLDSDRVLDGLSNRLENTLAKQDQTYLFSPDLYQLGYDQISHFLADFLAYEPYVSQPDKLEELHAMRIAAKRLRYCMEIFASLYPGELKDQLQACRKIQDQLGDLHDCDVWISFLPQFLADERRRILEFFGNLNGYYALIPGVECFLEDRRRMRETSYQDFVRAWEKQQDQQTWPKLSAQIQIPFFRGEPPVEETPPAPPQEPSNG